MPTLIHNFVQWATFVLVLWMVRAWWIHVIKPAIAERNEKGLPIIIFKIKSITFKTKGGRMTVEQSSKQKFSFDVQFKNKNGNPARVDGAISASFVDPNTGEPVTTTATVTTEAVNADEDGNSSTHKVTVETSAEEIQSISTAKLQATADVDIKNDKDDSTDDDVESKTFDLLNVVFVPLKATEVGIENLTPVEDVV